MIRGPYVFLGYSLTPGTGTPKVRDWGPIVFSSDPLGAPPPPEGRTQDHLVLSGEVTTTEKLSFVGSIPTAKILTVLGPVPLTSVRDPGVLLRFCPGANTGVTVSGMRGRPAPVLRCGRDVPLLTVHVARGAVAGPLDGHGLTGEVVGPPGVHREVERAEVVPNVTVDRQEAEVNHRVTNIGPTGPGTTAGSHLRNTTFGVTEAQAKGQEVTLALLVTHTEGSVVSLHRSPLI